jgi:hypothetical protein
MPVNPRSVTAGNIQPMGQAVPTIWMQSAGAGGDPHGCGGCVDSPTGPACRGAALGEPCLAPRLQGDPATLKRVLQALDEEAADAEGGIVGRHCVKSLRIGGGEAELVVTFPPSCGGGKALAESAFATLRRLLPDTDVYVLHAP